ncbi:MAG: hypothetical protein JKY65_16830 [Planctomycetes bacterium]|nr:hypothetical protein [Planctomycetota bacterium]
MTSSPHPTFPTASPFRLDLSSGDALDAEGLIDSLAELFVRAVIARRS